jgi:hypothetical protein
LLSIALRKELIVGHLKNEVLHEKAGNDIGDTGMEKNPSIILAS